MHTQLSEKFALVPSCSVSASVPTVDTTRTSWILEQMVKIRRPVLLVGESGTSKTATIHNFLKKLNADTRVSLKFKHAYVYSLHHLSPKGSRWIAEFIRLFSRSLLSSTSHPEQLH